MRTIRICKQLEPFGPFIGHIGDEAHIERVAGSPLDQPPKQVPMSRSLIAAGTLLLMISLAAPCSFAQDAPDQPPPDQAQGQEQDPPSRVARLSLTQGSVSLEPAGAQEWATADLNRPLTTGDKLWTDQSSRAELDIGAAAIRLGQATGFSFLNLDDHTAQMQVTAGTVIVRVRSLDQGDNYEI